MDHFIRSLKIFWRSERLLRENELRLITQKTMCHALAGLVDIFGLVMLSLAVFFAFVPYTVTITEERVFPRDGRGHGVSKKRLY